MANILDRISQLSNQAINQVSSTASNLAKNITKEVGSISSIAKDAYKYTSSNLDQYVDNLSNSFKNAPVPTAVETAYRGVSAINPVLNMGRIAEPYLQKTLKTVSDTTGLNTSALSKLTPENVTKRLAAGVGREIVDVVPGTLSLVGQASDVFQRVGEKTGSFLYSQYTGIPYSDLRKASPTQPTSQEVLKQGNYVRDLYNKYVPEPQDTVSRGLEFAGRALPYIATEGLVPTARILSRTGGEAAKILEATSIKEGIKSAIAPTAANILTEQGRIEGVNPEASIGERLLNAGIVGTLGLGVGGIAGAIGSKLAPKVSSELTSLDDIYKLVPEINEKDIAKLNSAGIKTTEDLINTEQKTVASILGNTKKAATKADKILNQVSDITQSVPTLDVPSSPILTQTAQPVEIPTSQVALPKKTSKVALSIQEQAATKNLVKDFEELAGYSPITIKDQESKITNLIANDIDQVKRIVKGQESVPQGLNEGMLIKVIEEHAQNTNNIELLKDLANSPLVSETSSSAQILRALAERNPDSALPNIQAVKKAREIAAESKFGGKSLAQVEKETIQEIRAAKANKIPTKNDWVDFIDSITC